MGKAKNFLAVLLALFMLLWGGLFVVGCGPAAEEEAPTVEEESVVTEEGEEEESVVTEEEEPAPADELENEE